jgi:protein-L-isoaspartate(D-aspartate) O-methyltransferase
LDRLADFRRVFAHVVVARADCRDPAIRKAFARVPRHEFLGPGPWYFSERGVPTASDDPALVYHDAGMGLAADRGIPTGLPSLHARCIAACELKPGERVAHVGAGSGYFTAILAELVGARGEVLAIEIDTELAERARHNLHDWPWARVESRSGVDVPQADVIYVSAGVERLPRGWLEALRPGGRLLFPLVPAKAEGSVVIVREVGSRFAFTAELICPARFVPCVGTEDEEARAALIVSFRTKTRDSVRSLRLHPDEPDESAWFAGSGWWLSTRPA